MTGPHFGMIPRRVAKLRLPGRVHAVLDVIACHANPKKGNRAYLRRETIANEAGIDCSKVSLHSLARKEWACGDLRERRPRAREYLPDHSRRGGGDARGGHNEHRHTPEHMRQASYDARSTMSVG